MNNKGRFVLLVYSLWFVVLVAPVIFAQPAVGQNGDKECEELKKDITALQQMLVDLAVQRGDLERQLEVAEKGWERWKNSEAIKRVLRSRLQEEEFKSKLLDAGAHWLNAVVKLKHAIEENKSEAKGFQDALADFLNKLGDCAKKKPERVPTPSPAPTEHALRVPAGNDLPMLVRDGRVKIDTVGTGETIGHVADLKIENLTDQPINCAIPPMVLESKGRKNQDYVCAKPQTAKIDPYGTATVPIDGVCVNRNKPPVGKGVSGDLVVNTGDPTVPQSPDSHVPADKARDLLRICTAKYEAAEKLQKDGTLKDLPYKDKEKQKQIVEQWSTWSDPRISEITGAPPATKDDLKKVVYKQLEEKGPMSRETKKKVDQGIDTIFEKVELTTAKAKDLEKPQEPESSPPAPPPQTY